MTTKKTTRSNSRAGSNQGDMDSEDSGVDVHGSMSMGGGSMQPLLSASGVSSYGGGAPSLSSLVDPQVSLLDQQEKDRLRVQELEEELKKYKGKSRDKVTPESNQDTQAETFFQLMLQSQQAMVDKLASISTSIRKKVKREEWADAD